MAKVGEVVEDAKALERRFFDTLTAANSQKAKPAAVKAFRDALRECERAGAVPWGRLKDPLGAARQIALEKAKAVLGPAVPEVWDAQADHRVRPRAGVVSFACISVCSQASAGVGDRKGLGEGCRPLLALPC
jgi:hypothetical protein